MRNAVLDLGSQTFHAIVAEVDTVGVRRVAFDRKTVARLGEHAYASGRITRAAHDLALAQIGELVERVQLRHPTRFRIVATGVFRDAENGGELLREASERFGVAIDLLDGAEEAQLTWLAVSAELAGSHGRLAVVDLGGGSLELAAGEHTVEIARSLPLGVMQLRGVTGVALRAHVGAVARDAVAELRGYAPDTVALTSGTARTLLALARRLGAVGVIQRHVCARTFTDLARRLAPLSHDAIEVLGVSRKRRDTIAAGAAAIAAVLQPLGKPVVYVARSALREGALIQLARTERIELPLRARAAG